MSLLFHCLCKCVQAPCSDVMVVFPVSCQLGGVHVLQSGAFSACPDLQSAPAGSSVIIVPHLHVKHKRIPATCNCSGRSCTCVIGSVSCELGSQHRDDGLMVGSQCTGNQQHAFLQWSTEHHHLLLDGSLAIQTVPV